jgi:hypothetical protein
MIATTADAATFTIDASQSFLSIVVGGYDGDTFTAFTTPQQTGRFNEPSRNAGCELWRCDNWNRRRGY